MNPTVAILIFADAPPAMAAAMVSACSRAHGLCREGQAGPGEVSATFRWADAKHLGAEVVVELPAGKRERSLRFSAADPEVERWRAAGVAIAVLVGESLPDPDATPPPSSSAPAPPAPPAPPPPSAPAAPASASAPAAPTFRGAAGPVITTGLEGHPRVGVEGRASVGRGVLALGATLPSKPQGVREQLSWISIGAVSVPIQGASMSLSGRLELLLERQDAELLGEGSHDARHRWMPGARVGVDAARLLAKPFWIGASIDIGGRLGKTTVFRHGQQVGQIHLFRPGAGVWLAAGF